VAFTLAGSIFAMFLYLTLYVQDDLGYGPLAAGLRFLPITLMSFIVAPFAGKLTVRIQARYLMGTGLVLVGLGQLLMGMTSPTSGWTQLLPGFLIAGAGIGLTNPVLASSAISVVPPERSGMASGINNTFRQVGIATGIAALGAIFQHQIQAKTIAALSATAQGRETVAHFGHQLGAALTAGQVHTAANAIPTASGREALVNAYRVGFSSSLNLLLMIGAVVAAVGAVGAYTLVRQRDFVPSYTPPPAGGEGAPAGDGAPATAGATGAAGAADGSQPEAVPS
jgi:MFS family permease